MIAISTQTILKHCLPRKNMILIQTLRLAMKARTTMEVDPMLNVREKSDKKKRRRRKKLERKEGPRKKRKKKKRLPGQPRRNQTAYLLWLNENRRRIEKENPKMSFEEIGKKAGELWKAVEDKSKWEEEAEKDKKRYDTEMEKWKAEGGSEALRKAKSKKSTSSKSSSKSSGNVGNQYTSKEFIESGEDSSD